MTTSRMVFESTQGALSKFALARSCDAPDAEQARFMDLANLHAKVATLPEHKGRVLLRLRGMAGQPAFSKFVRIIS